MKGFRIIFFTLIGAITIAQPMRLDAYLVIEYKIHFPPGIAKIQERSLPILQDLSQSLKANPDVNLILEGHSDVIEDKKHGEKLSLRRAQAAKDYLISTGIDPSRLFLDHFGSSKPVDIQENDEARSRNRRVEFIEVKKQAVFEGLTNIPVWELEKIFKSQMDVNNIFDATFLGRFHQVVYARRARDLPVETWSGKSFYPWAEGDPGTERVLAPADPISQREFESHLIQSIKYFSLALKIESRVKIAGLPNFSGIKKLEAYRGLIWVYLQKNQIKKAEETYAKYQRSAIQVDSCLPPLAPKFHSNVQQGLDDAIACYETLLSQPASLKLGHYPNYIDDGKMRIKIRLARARALQAPTEQALSDYRKLFEEAFALDQRLLSFPATNADYSLQVWRLMLPYLDPVKDADFIEATLGKLKNAQLRTNQVN